MILSFEFKLFSFASMSLDTTPPKRFLDKPNSTLFEVRTTLNATYLNV